MKRVYNYIKNLEDTKSHRQTSSRRLIDSIRVTENSKEFVPFCRERNSFGKLLKDPKTIKKRTRMKHPKSIVIESPKLSPKNLLVKKHPFSTPGVGLYHKTLSWSKQSFGKFKPKAATEKSSQPKTCSTRNLKAHSKIKHQFPSKYGLKMHVKSMAIPKRNKGIWESMEIKEEPIEIIDYLNFDAETDNIKECLTENIQVLKKLK